MGSGKKIKAGQYVRRNSILHKCDARAKILAFVVFVICVFSFLNIWVLFGIAVFLVACCAIAKINFFSLVRSILPVLIGFAIISFFNAFVIHEGEVVFALGSLCIYSVGVYRSCLYAVRLCMTLLAGAFLLACTSQMQLTEGLGKLFSPLQKIGVPVSELSFVLALALRFVPVINSEVKTVITAQRLRGAHFTRGSFSKRIKAITSLVMPVTVGAIRKAEELSFALLSKNFVPGAPRTAWDYEGFQRRKKIVTKKPNTRV